MITIDSEPYSITKWFSGIYTNDENEEYQFTICSDEGTETITWVEESPTNSSEKLSTIESEIIQEFLNSDFEIKKKEITVSDFFDKYIVEKNRVVLEKLLKEKGELDKIDTDNMAPYNGCMYETYEEEYERVLKIAREEPKRVWTIIDNNDGWFGIVAGYHYVNRIGYFITLQDCEDENEEYTC